MIGMGSYMYVFVGCGLAWLPHGTGQAAANHKDAQLKEGNNQATPTNQIRVGSPEIIELLLASRALRIDGCIAATTAIRIAAAGGGHGDVISVACPATALELHHDRIGLDYYLVLLDWLTINLRISEVHPLDNPGRHHSDSMQYPPVRPSSPGTYRSAQRSRWTAPIAERKEWTCRWHTGQENRRKKRH